MPHITGPSATPIPDAGHWSMKEYPASHRNVMVSSVPVVHAHASPTKERRRTRRWRGTALSGFVSECFIYSVGLGVVGVPLPERSLSSAVRSRKTTYRKAAFLGRFSDACACPAKPNKLLAVTHHVAGEAAIRALHLWVPLVQDRWIDAQLIAAIGAGDFDFASAGELADLPKCAVAPPINSRLGLHSCESRVSLGVQERSRNSRGSRKFPRMTWLRMGRHLPASRLRSRSSTSCVAKRLAF